MIKEKPRPIQHPDVVSGIEKELIIYNDDVNSFEFVIETLVEVCYHDPDQAEQCALIAHIKGKCSIKRGDEEFLRPFAVEMTRRGLTV